MSADFQSLHVQTSCYVDIRGRCGQEIKYLGMLIIFDPSQLEIEVKLHNTLRLYYLNCEIDWLLISITCIIINILKYRQDIKYVERLLFNPS